MHQMAGNGDIKAHVGTYDRMIGLMKYGAIAVAFVTAMVIWLIAG
ncbi:aa3-type cytochrome c oxidase subunit IV [Sphingomonas cynarae]